MFGQIGKWVSNKGFLTKICFFHESTLNFAGIFLILRHIETDFGVSVVKVSVRFKVENLLSRHCCIS